MKDTSEYAFPSDPEWIDTGMTLRDYFAAQAITSRLLSGQSPGSLVTPELVAEQMYKIADAMIKERSK